MGFGWAAANANISVLLQEGGGGGTLGKAMALHMAAVLPTHSAHLICLDDQYDESIYKARRIPVIGGSSPVPHGPGLGCKCHNAVNVLNIFNMHAQHTLLGRSTNRLRVRIGIGTSPYCV